MWRNLLFTLALCGFVCTIAACSKGPQKGEANYKPVENKPGTQDDGTVNTDDSASAAIE